MVVGAVTELHSRYTSALFLPEILRMAPLAYLALKLIEL